MQTQSFHSRVYAHRFRSITTRKNTVFKKVLNNIKELFRKKVDESRGSRKSKVKQPIAPARGCEEEPQRMKTFWEQKTKRLTNCFPQPTVGQTRRRRN